MQITNDVQVRSAAPGRHRAAPNLFLVVIGGGKAWEFLFTAPNGKRRTMGLGSYPEISLAGARAKAAECRVSIAKGVDPIEARRAAAPARGLPTFAELAADWFEAFGKAWPEAYADERKAEMARVTAHRINGKPFADKPVNEITRQDVAEVFKAWRASAPSVARRVRGQMERMLDYAIARELVAVNVALKRPLDALIGPPSHKTKNHEAMPYDDVPAFLAKLTASDRYGAKALAFLILTAMRRDEVREMTWSEVNLDKRLWTVPAKRMKARVERIVPLSDAAIEILKQARKEAWGGRDYVFDGRNGPLAKCTMWQTLRGLTADGETFTVHGFRSSFRNWAHRETSHPHDICEEALSHEYGSQVERAYRRGQAIEKVRVLLDDWAAFCAGTRGDNVIPLRRSA
jgi:integrase